MLLLRLPANKMKRDDVEVRILRSIENGSRAVISHSSQINQCLIKAMVIRQRRHVFHHDCFGSQAPNEAHELEKKIVTRIINDVLSIQSSHAREALAGAFVMSGVYKITK